MNELRFDGLTAVITGAGRGFGRCHAMLLASRGANVVIVDNGCDADGTGSSPEPVQQVAKEVDAAGGNVVPVFASVTEEGGVEEIVTAALDSFGGIDILVNNAGIVDPLHFDELNMEKFRRMVEVHYLGTVQMTMAAWPHIRKAAKGAVVNTASDQDPAWSGVATPRPVAGGGFGCAFAPAPPESSISGTSRSRKPATKPTSNTACHCAFAPENFAAPT